MEKISDYLKISSLRLLVPFAELRKATISFVISVRPSVSHQSDCHEISYFNIFRKSVDTVQAPLTLSLLMSYIYGAPSKARNLMSYIYGRDFLLGILLLEPCISLIYALKTNKYTDYSFSLLIIYSSSYRFRHYIAIYRERSYCLLRDAQLRSC
jgi:hypothetical protein